MKLRSFSEHLRVKAQATADIGDATDFAQAAAQLDLYEAALRLCVARLKAHPDRTTLDIEAIDAADTALNSTDTGA